MSFTAGQADLKASVTFKAKARKDLWAVVNFTRPFSTSDLHASVTFLHRNDLPANVKFMKKADLQASITWLAVHATEDLDASVKFLQKHDLSSSVTFTPGGYGNLPASVNFLRAKDLQASVRWVHGNSLDLPATVTFGRFHKDLPAYVTFWQNNLVNFKATITIQAYVQPKISNYANLKDFKCSLHIQQHGNADLPGYVRFYRNTTADLPATVRFVQYTNTNFPVTMTINNEAQGTDNVTVTVTGGVGDVIVPVTTDAFGYFNIINLPPGDYYITPQRVGFAFSPASIPVTLVDQNITLFFYSNGVFAGQSDAFATFPIGASQSDNGGCYVDQTSGQAGTLSIDGYIMPQGSLPTIPPLFTIATDEAQAADFRDTLN